MKTAILLQARMGSTRLPGKVLKEICGKSVLALILERLNRCQNADVVVVTTTKKPQDDAIVTEAKNLSNAYYRGSETNVLDRFYKAAKHFKADIIVRTTADCPFLEPSIIDFMIDFFKAGNWDYATNALQPTFPDGLDTEVFSFQALEKAWHEAKDKRQKEHVTPYFYENPDLFRITNIISDENLAHLRWVIDKPEDLIFVRSIYEKLYPKKPAFTFRDVLDLLQRDTDIQALSPKSLRNEGFFANSGGNESKKATWAEYVQGILENKKCSIHQALCKV